LEIGFAILEQISLQELLLGGDDNLSENFMGKFFRKNFHVAVFLLIFANAHVFSECLQIYDERDFYAEILQLQKFL